MDYKWEWSDEVDGDIIIRVSGNNMSRVVDIDYLVKFYVENKINKERN